MKIQEFAQQAGLPAKTIRYYESIGILTSPQRAPNGYREYSEKDLARARFVAGTRSLDLSLEDIREILAMRDRREAPCRTLLNLIEQKANQIEERIHLLKQMELDLRQLHQLGLTFPTDDIDGKNCICHLVIEHSSESTKSGYLLMEVQTLASLKEIYQASREYVLLLAVLSPTGGPCLRGAQLVQEIFEENESKVLCGAIIWTPMLLTDSLDAANEREARFSDTRVRQSWDQDRLLGSLLSQILNLKTSMAWDVYLVYPPNHTWETALPAKPIFWMHQLDEEPALLLDPPRLKKYIQTLLERTDFQ